MSVDPCERASGLVGFEALRPREALSAVLTQGGEGRGPPPRLRGDCGDPASASTAADRGPGKNASTEVPS